MTTTELLAIAHAATPGEWDVRYTQSGYPDQIYAPDADPHKPGGICDITRQASICMPSSAEGEANARHIATFAPARIIALLEERERLLEFVQAWDAQEALERNADEGMDLFEVIDKAQRLRANAVAKRRALDEA